METASNSDVKRRQVVALAAELFDRSGYHTTNVAELARAVGISKPTLYHYFSSKDEILFWIHEEFIDLLLERHSARSGLSASESLIEVVSDVLGLMSTHRGHVRVFFEHLRELSPKDQATIQKKRDAYQDAVEEIVRRGIDGGEFRPVDARLTTLAIFGMCNWAYHWYRADGPMTPRGVAEHFYDLVVNGLTAVHDRTTLSTGASDDGR
jgi:TetR/AcrR family transcriptional regulator, cholesterol catabolism regulator